MNHLTVPIPLIFVFNDSPWIGESIGESCPMKSEEIGVIEFEAPLSMTIGTSFLLL